MKEKLKNNKGITLIALVVTIVVLLILAGVSINLVVGNNGIINKAKDAKNKTEEAKTEEEDFFSKLDKDIQDEIGEELPIKIVVNSGEDGKVILPINETCKVDWGDGTITEHTQIGPYEPGFDHTYSKTNTNYTVSINGKITSINADRCKTKDYIYYKDRIIEISQWGNTGLTDIFLSNCENLKKIASPSVNSFRNVTDFSYAFADCTSLTNIPENLFTNCQNVTDFKWTFKGCTSLTSIPENLFVNCRNVTGFESTFRKCTSLINIPENLFLNCPNVKSFINTFAYCSNIQGNVPKLWILGTNTLENSHKGNPDGNGCFANCTKITGYSTIPQYWITYCIETDDE